MRRWRAGVVLAVALGACGGGGDGKTGIRVTVELGADVPSSTVNELTRIDVTLSAGSATDSVKIPLANTITDGETSFRYLDDGRFAGMTVHLTLSLVAAGDSVIFTDARDVAVKRGSTVEVRFDFGDNPDGGVDSGPVPDAGNCPIAPVCGTVASKTCVEGQFVEFGTGAGIAGNPLQLTVHDSSNGSVIATALADACGRFATPVFTPPAGGKIGLVADDPDGAVTDRFERTGDERSMIVPGINLTGVNFRVMSRAEDETLSRTAGLCTTSPCPAAQTFAGRGSVVAFYEIGDTPASGVRLTRAVVGTAPSLITTNVKYFSDNVAGLQTSVTPPHSETTGSAAAIAVSPSTGDFVIGGTGALLAGIEWVPVQAYSEPNLITIVDAVHSASRSCDPLDPGGCTNESDACYPTSAGVLCANPGIIPDDGGCGLPTECEKGLTCDPAGGVCRPLCSLAGPACGGGRTCTSVGGSATVGVCH